MDDIDTMTKGQKIGVVLIYMGGVMALLGALAGIYSNWAGW